MYVLNKRKHRLHIVTRGRPHKLHAKTLFHAFHFCTLLKMKDESGLCITPEIQLQH